MTDNSELDLALGRIAALELLVTGLMVEAMERQAPGADVTSLYREMRAGLQVSQRPHDGRSDAIWEIASRELDRIFTNIQARVAGE